MFNSRTQQPGETIDQFVTDLRSKAKNCEFETLADGLICDRVVCGVLSGGTRSRLLKEATLTLDVAIDICRADEATTTRMKSLATGERNASDKDLDMKLLNRETERPRTNVRQGQPIGMRQH